MSIIVDGREGILKNCGQLQKAKFHLCYNNDINNNTSIDRKLGINMLNSVTMHNRFIGTCNV